jgi:hypothetical protein
MAVLYTIVEGWTQELGPFTLRKDGVAINLLNITVDLILEPSHSLEPITFTGVVRKADQTQVGNHGQMFFKPAASDLLNKDSPYLVRWKLTDASGVVFAPSGEQDQIIVNKP